MECEMQESYVEFTKHLNLYESKTDNTCVSIG